MSAHLLDVQNLSVAFGTINGPVEVLNDVSFHVDAGESLVILGESGSGKSVTASAIMDLLDRPPAEITSGRILFEGENLLGLPEAARRAINGKDLAIVFQDPLAHLHPLKNIGTQMVEGMMVHGARSRAECWDEAVRLLERVGIREAEHRIRQYPHQFSGGQRQRVMIAMALSVKPKLLIADEPTTSLDVTVQARILKLVRELCSDLGMALILITHDLSVAANMGDRVVVMRRGRIVEAGSTRATFENPSHPYTQELLRAVHAAAHQAQPDSRGEELLRVENIRKDYFVPAGLLKPRVVHAVKGVSFTVSKGETLAIVGESGSGKSTIARLLMRLEEATGGAAYYRGENILPLKGSVLREHRRRVQMVFQDPYSSLNPQMRVSEIIAEPLAVHPDILPRSAWPARVAELLTMVGLSPDRAKRYPHQFSGGERQRIAIARALASEPELLICDEAVSSLDVSIQAQVIALLADLRDRLGLAYIFISHDLHVVQNFADRVLVMKDGEFVEEGKADEIFARPHEAYTRELVTATPKPKWELGAAASSGVPEASTAGP
jgi:peptide/nickel transport system ATP-binding protein